MKLRLQMAFWFLENTGKSFLREFSYLSPSMVGDKKITILGALGSLIWQYLVLSQYQKQEYKPLKFNKSTQRIQILFNNKTFDQITTTFSVLNQQNIPKEKIQNTG